MDNTSYTYNTAGLTTSETDEQLGSASDEETQCFTYTSQGQLSQAWTATDDCAATPTTASDSTVGDALGMASEYFESWTYNALGERASQTALDPSTGTFSTTDYTYSSSQPTVLTGTSTTGAVTGSTSYAYNADGEQTTRDTSTGDQTLSWNNLGELTGATTTSTGAQVASYAYNADGSLLSQTNGSTTTLYLPNEQITDAGGTISGIRYYTLPGGATAVRTGSGNDYSFEIASDQHGTNTLYLDYTAQDPTWRQFDPYGNPRGASVTWIDNRAFLGDVTDTSTGLTDIGARWYDPVTGSFISLDPLLETGSPLQLNGYTYAADDAVSSSDPTGQLIPGPSGDYCPPGYAGCEPLSQYPSGPPPGDGGGGGSSGGSGGSSPSGIYQTLASYEGQTLANEYHFLTWLTSFSYTHNFSLPSFELWNYKFTISGHYTITSSSTSPWTLDLSDIKDPQLILNIPGGGTINLGKEGLAGAGMQAFQSTLPHGQTQTVTESADRDGSLSASYDVSATYSRGVTIDEGVTISAQYNGPNPPPPPDPLGDMVKVFATHQMQAGQDVSNGDYAGAAGNDAIAFGAGVVVISGAVLAFG